MNNLKFCIFCSIQSENEGELIEISKNAIEFENKVVDFVDLIQILFNLKIKDEENSLICERCKDLLVQFYIFAEKIKMNNENFVECENLSNLCKQYLDSTSEVFCSRYNKCLILAPESKRKFVETFQLLQPVITIDSDLSFEEPLSKKRKLSTQNEDEAIDENNIIEEEILNEEEEEENLVDYQEEGHFQTSSQLEYEIVRTSQELNVVDNIEEIEILQEYEEEEAEAPVDELNSYQPSNDGNKKLGNSRRFYCSRCNYQFSTQAHFQSHNNGHKLFDCLAKYLKYPKCDVCNIMLVDFESLEIHNYNHDNDAVHSEGFFLKHGFYRDDLETTEEEIFDENSTKCGHCLKQLKDSEECVKHLLIFHVKILTCPLDNREFNGNQAYTIHMKNNHPELFPDLKFRCSVCKMEFETIYEKLAHMKNCEEKKFSCHHCDKTFSRKCHLKKHLRQISGESNIVCELCHKICRDKHDYQIHFRSHSTEKFFKCSLCTKTYKTSSARAAHLQSHSAVLPCCPYCNTQFKSRRTMQKHVKLKHEKNQVVNEIDIYS